MGLAEPGRPADEQRVVGEPGHLGDRQRGRVGESVGVADDELVEREARVELLGRGARGRRRRRPVVARRRRSATRVPEPSTAAVHAASSRAKLVSIQARLSAGASTTSVPPSSLLASSGSSQSCHVESLTARRISARMRRQACGRSASGTSARKSLLRREVGGRTMRRGASRRPGSANIAEARGPARRPSGGSPQTAGVRSEALCAAVDGVCTGVCESAGRYPVPPLPARAGRLRARPAAKELT